MNPSSWRNRIYFGATFAILGLASTNLWADTLTVESVASGAWAIVGTTGQRGPDNLGNNATFGLIETTDGAILIDAGGSAAGAEALAEAAATVTSQPITLVINTGGQDHRWLGNDWFKQHGARILASTGAIADQTKRADAQVTAMQAQVGEARFAGTRPAHADTAVDHRQSLTLGNVTIDLVPTPGAHTPGDMIVWLPASRVAFTGDLVYHDRLLGVIDVSDTRNWLESFDMLAALEPQVVVPGHGKPGPLRQSEDQTRDYLLTLRGQIRAVLEAGGDETAATSIDQSAFSSLANYDELARRNALQAYVTMEWE